MSEDKSLPEINSEICRLFGVDPERTASIKIEVSPDHLPEALVVLHPTVAVFEAMSKVTKVKVFDLEKKD